MFNKKIVHLSLYLDYLQFNSSYYYDLSFGNEMDKYKKSFCVKQEKRNSNQKQINDKTKQKSFKEALTFNLKKPSELELNKQLNKQPENNQNDKIKSNLFQFEELTIYLKKYPIEKHLYKQLKIDIKSLLNDWNNNNINVREGRLKKNTTSLLTSLQFLLEILWNETYSNNEHVTLLYQKILYFYEYYFYSYFPKNKQTNDDYGKIQILSKNDPIINIQ